MAEELKHERTIEFGDPALANELFGPQNSNLRRLEIRHGVSLETRGTTLVLRADDEANLDLVASGLVQLYDLLRSGHPIFPQDIDHAMRMLARDPSVRIAKVFQDVIFAVSPKRTVAPKTLSQRDYLAAIRELDMVFGIGPAGTGKTYLAVAMAVSFLTSRKVKRIVLTRPAVEAGEKLGFLPGDIAEKINPYLRPLYDALHDMLDFRKVQDMIQTGIIEVAPLAFMRGRTLNDSFIILDEAQNTTPEQMKMFLTRMGFGSKAVVTGDVTQIDLPGSARSGLIQAEKVLSHVPDLRFIHFHEEDVIRHPLVGRIVQAYERYSNSAEEEAR